MSSSLGAQLAELAKLEQAIGDAFTVNLASGAEGNNYSSPSQGDAEYGAIVFSGRTGMVGI
jgi:hypothetical protein